MSRTSLIHCSQERCLALLWPEEAIDGSKFGEVGLYCLDCAHLYGYFSAGDVELLGRLLEEAGMWTRPRVQTVVTVTEQLKRSSKIPDHRLQFDLQ